MQRQQGVADHLRGKLPMPFLLKVLFFIEVLMVVGLVTFRYALHSKYRDTISIGTVAICLTTPVVALFCGNSYVFLSYLVLVTAFSSRSRASLANNYIFLLPLMPMLTQDTYVGGAYLLATSTLLAINSGALLGYIISAKQKSYSSMRIDISMFMLVVIFTYIYNRDANFTSLLRGIVTAILGVAGPYLLISRGITKQADVDKFLLRLSLGAFLSSIVGIFQAGKKWLLFQAYYDALHVSIPFGTSTLSIRGGLLRTGGTMLDYSAAGVFFAAVLCTMPTLKNRFHFLGFWAVVGGLIGGLVATQSRGAWIAAALGYVFVLVFRRQWSKAALLTVVGISAQVTALIFSKSGILTSISGKTSEAISTVSYRKQLAIRGFEQIQNHPLLGQSPEQLVNSLSDLTQGQHIVDFVNSHLFIAMAGGVPLFLIWCYVWLAPVVEAWHHPSRGKIGGDLVEVPAVIIVPVMIALTATSIVDRNLAWPLIAVALAGPCFALARQQVGATSKLSSPLVHLGMARSGHARVLSSTRPQI